MRDALAADAQPSMAARHALAAQLSLTVDQVSGWMNRQKQKHNRSTIATATAPLRHSARLRAPQPPPAAPTPARMPAPPEAPTPAQAAAAAVAAALLALLARCGADPPAEERRALAARLGVSNDAIAIWFFRVREQQAQEARLGGAASAHAPAACQPPQAQQAAAERHAADGALLLTPAALVPLCLRRSEVALLAAAPDAVLAPFGGLEALLPGACVRIRVPLAGNGGASAYQLLPVRRCGRDAATGSLLLLLLPACGASVAVVPVTTLSNSTPLGAAAEAELAAAVRALTALGVMRAQVRDKAAELAAALAAADACVAASKDEPPAAVMPAQLGVVPMEEEEAVADAVPRAPLLPLEQHTPAGCASSLLERLAAAAAELPQDGCTRRSRERSADEQERRNRSRSRDRERSGGGSGSGSPSHRLATPEQPHVVQQHAATALLAAAHCAPPAAAVPPTAAAPTTPPDDAAVWHYNTPRNGVHGPFSLAQLATFREALLRLGRWHVLRVWRTGQAEADAVLLATLLP